MWGGGSQWSKGGTKVHHNIVEVFNWTNNTCVDRYFLGVGSSHLQSTNNINSVLTNILHFLWTCLMTLNFVVVKILWISCHLFRTSSTRIYIGVLYGHFGCSKTKSIMFQLWVIHILSSRYHCDWLSLFSIDHTISYSIFALFFSFNAFSLLIL